MNLFILDRDPRIAAAMHCDRDILGLCVSLAQTLCSAHHKHGTLEFIRARGAWVTEKGRETYAPYESIPEDDVVLWAAAAPGNYQFVRRMLHGALSEYQERYGDASGKRHKTWTMYDGLREAPRPLRALFLEKPLTMTPFVRRILGRDNIIQRPAQPFFDELEQGQHVDVVTLHRHLYRARSRAEPPTYRTGNTPRFML